jgi:spore germination protein YaaH
MNLSQAPWPAFLVEARAHNERVIPTIMWSDGAAIHRVLSTPALRNTHVNSIVNAVYANNWDGIDIDYEAKLAATNPYFSIFLKQLYTALGPKKWVMCTIEPRTPLDSRNTAATNATPQYANNYADLNKYCDRVRIMAYDQASVDRKLTSAADGPYIPVADPRWVEKVIKEAMTVIAKNKIMIGVGTYGYEYEVTPLLSGYKYKRLWAFNPRYATELMATLGIAPTRNVAGELSFIYRPNASSTEPLAAAPTLSGAGASFNILWWSDAQAIEDKIKLAKKLGVRGVSIFKIDGGADPKLWAILAKYK